VNFTTLTESVLLLHSKVVQTGNNPLGDYTEFDMPLTNDDITAIAEWQSIQEGFGREEAQTSIRIKAIVDRINLCGDHGCELLEDDGLSNYFTLFAFNVADVPSNDPYRRVDGLLVYLSACGPIGVTGPCRKCVGLGFSSHDPLQIETLSSPDQPSGPLEEKVFEAIRLGGYELLSVAEVSKPLPHGVKPFDYCFSPEPWDRVFHALFGNSD
jgi:hypothetical protein